VTSGNPAMNEAVFQRAGYADSSANAMSLPGTVLKTSILVMLLVLTGGFTWKYAAAGELALTYGLAIGGLIGGAITAFVTIFFPRASPFTAPIYAALEGLVLGAVSFIYDSMYPGTGIVIQAVGLTVGVLIMMLFIYGTGIIRVTEKVKIGIIAATGAVCLVYLVSWIMSLFGGGGIPYIHGSGPIGIGFSVIVVIIAALNLLLNFDFIEQRIRQGAPKFMEWYGGFTLLMTLVWMYLEILRLLAKLKDNRG
jgi:uncharacterized YccA/Bax inhibitor family protein